MSFRVYKSWLEIVINMPFEEALKRLDLHCDSVEQTGWLSTCHESIISFPECKEKVLVNFTHKTMSLV
ncbi:MAG: hypothetical protein ACRCUS_00915 [Anaerovoracaceae bacterium]